MRKRHVLPLLLKHNYIVDLYISLQHFLAVVGLSLALNCLDRKNR
jgi:hypothetical protein